MNAAYKHLEAKLRIGELTVGQWCGLVVGGVVALMWGFYVSPFGAPLTIFTACYVGALPAGAIVFAATSDLDVVLLVRSAIRWRHEEGRYLAGGGPPTRGYAIAPDPRQEHGAAHGPTLAELDLTALWDG